MARRALGPARLRLARAVGSALQPADGSLLVACSGGADSLALADAAVQVAARRNLALAATVVDHGLQDDSAAVAERAVGQLIDLGVADAEVVSVTVGSSADGPEAAAREARYAALRGESRRRGATVLLGHTLDDQAETVLLGLARGSGTRSLAGMARRVGPFLRPLLELPRAVTVAACAELGIEPWSDPHNAASAYARSRVRHRVLPVLDAEIGPGIAEALARTAALARDDADLLDELAVEAQPAVLVAGDLDCAGLAALPRALRTRILRTWLVVQGGRDLGYGHVAAVETLVTDWHGQGPIEVPGLAVRRVAGRLTRSDRGRAARG